MPHVRLLAGADEFLAPALRPRLLRASLIRTLIGGRLATISYTLCAADGTGVATSYRVHTQPVGIRRSTCYSSST